MGWWVGLIQEYTMKQGDEGNPEAKSGPSYGHSMHLNHSKLIESTVSMLSVTSQLTTHHSNKSIAI